MVILIYRITTNNCYIFVENNKRTKTKNRIDFNINTVIVFYYKKSLILNYKANR